MVDDTASAPNDIEARLRRIEKQLESSTTTDTLKEPIEGPLRLMVWVIFGFILIFVLASLGARLWLAAQTIDDSSATEDEAEAVLIRANESVQSVELLLSFLEGASVLMTIGIGAAALYGVRQANDVRNELEAQLRSMEDAKLMVLTRRSQLENLDQLEHQIDDKLGAVEGRIEDMALMLQANQEFALGNHDEAFKFATQVLEHDPDNSLALYIGGWIGIRHRDKTALNQALNWLEKLVELQADWPTAKAVYGVALRRWARNIEAMAPPEDYLDAMEDALGYLLEALRRNDKLIDLDNESFWGPVGGIQRERAEHFDEQAQRLRAMGDSNGAHRLERARDRAIEDALDAYFDALEATPGSSYPLGNIASLTLWQVKLGQRDEAEYRQPFLDTVHSAERRLERKPNDYWSLMDLTMAKTMLGQFKEADKHRNQALQLSGISGLLPTSLGGIEDLLRFLPKGDHWNDIRQHLENHRDILVSHINAARPTTTTEEQIDEN